MLAGGPCLVSINTPPTHLLPLVGCSLGGWRRPAHHGGQDPHIQALKQVNHITRHLPGSFPLQSKGRRTVQADMLVNLSDKSYIKLSSTSARLVPMLSAHVSCRLSNCTDAPDHGSGP